MSSKPPYVSDEYKHLLAYSDGQSNSCPSPNQALYNSSRQQQYQPGPNMHYQAYGHQQQYFQYRPPLQQPIAFLPGPQQPVNNNAYFRVNHDSYAADGPNDLYPSLNNYEKEENTPNDDK